MLNGAQQSTTGSAWRLQTHWLKKSADTQARPIFNYLNNMKGSLSLGAAGLYQ